MNGTEGMEMAPNGTGFGLGVSMVQFLIILAPVASTIDRYVTPIFYVIGILTNPLSAYVWLSEKTRRNNSSAIYLGSLSLSHFLFLILHIFMELAYAWNVRTYDMPVACESFNAFFIMPQYFGPLAVLGFTVERYIAICHPFIKERYCTVHRAIVVVLCLMGLSMVLGVMQAYFWMYQEDAADGLYCNHRPNVQAFFSVWTWTTELMVFGVVPLAALVFNIRVIKEIRSLTASGPAYQQPGSSGTAAASTVTLLSVSFYLICTWLPSTIVYCLQSSISYGPILNTMEEYRQDPTWRKWVVYYTVKKIVEEATLSNSACYFFIYYITGKHFRDRVLAIFKVKSRCRKKKKNMDAKYIAVKDSRSQTLNGNTTVATNV